MDNKGLITSGPTADPSFIIDFIDSVALDPIDPKIIYVGTNRGLFRSNNFVITISVGPNGTITPSGTITVNAGENKAFIITPNPGYRIKDVKVDGVSVGQVSTYTFTDVIANHTIEVIFEPLIYTITASAGVGGTISLSGTVAVNYGDSKTFTITPSEGYRISEVKVDDKSVGEVTIYTFYNVNLYHKIDAIFDPNTYTITASAGVGGSISPSGNIFVNYSESKTFTITSNTGYKIKDVLVDGESVGALTTYTFEKVPSDHTISVTFEKRIIETVIVLQIGKSNFTVNGVSNTLDLPPIIKNSRTLLPIRAVIESLGGSVFWEATERKVTVSLGSTIIKLWIGKATAKVNGVDTPIDSTNSKVVPEIINSRTMLPLRFIAETLGCDVQWDGVTKTITITYVNRG